MVQGRKEGQQGTGLRGTANDCSRSSKKPTKEWLASEERGAVGQGTLRTLECDRILQQRGTRSTSGRGGAGSCASPLGLDCNNGLCVFRIGQGEQGTESK